MEERYHHWNMLDKCVQTVPKTIVVRQVIGVNERQKTIDIRLCVPRNKPAIEQIIDVLVKNVRITHVEIIPGKVIVRGHCEIKAIYVACLPSQPVHALQMRRVRFTVDVPIRGAYCGMDAEASIFVEYVDYNCVGYARGYGPKHGNYYDDDDYDYDDWANYPQHHHDHEHCDHDNHHHDSCDHHHDHCKPCCHPCKDHCKCFREFDVSIVLRIVAKVMTDREVILYPTYPGLPAKPKG